MAASAWEVMAVSPKPQSFPSVATIRGRILNYSKLRRRLIFEGSYIVVWRSQPLSKILVIPIGSTLYLIFVLSLFGIDAHQTLICQGAPWRCQTNARPEKTEQTAGTEDTALRYCTNDVIYKHYYRNAWPLHMHMSSYPIADTNLAINDYLTTASWNSHLTKLRPGQVRLYIE